MILKMIQKYWRNEDALAAMESALVFPIILVILLAVFDLGNGILVSQKTIRASQVTADLITRTRSVDSAAINEAVQAGELALQPFPIESYGVDVVSIRFDENEVPEIVWRETRGMTTDGEVLNRVLPLAAPNEGVVVVNVEYLFQPTFAGIVVDNIAMNEVAFARGRRSAVVNRE